ncbi:hypothetical protein Cni_G13496 [Canna indica]|uniref:Uncharacterized protein n=1 Tax=Canna indica TaxID=4628 RepID=A0AAQ3KBC3_9LILI|nr:hypothetical protein Cni_G13496 [Canna indica]
MQELLNAQGDRRRRERGRSSLSLLLADAQFLHISQYERIALQISFDEFDEYIFDRPRVFRAMFPDIRRSKRLNDEEWRIQMLPIQFLFASVNPVVVMWLRHKSNGKEYPSGVPKLATGIFELQAVIILIRGLDTDSELLFKCLIDCVTADKMGAPRAGGDPNASTFCPQCPGSVVCGQEQQEQQAQMASENEDKLDPHLQYTATSVLMMEKR